MLSTLSVGTRWSLLYTVVTLMALSIPIGFIYASVERQLERDARLLLESYLSEVRIEAESHPDDAAQIVGRFTERLNRMNSDVTFGAVLLTADGSEGFRVGALARAGSSRRPALVARAAIPGGEVEAALSDPSFTGSLERIRWTIFVAAPLALALSTVCGAWLARRSLRPIADMTRSARRIGGETLADRIPIRGTNDELDRLAATLNGMFDRLAEGMERLRGFSADAAHQLKSPLAALQNTIEVTLESGRTDEPTRHLLEGLLTQVAELAGCVSSMLRLARSESGLSDGQAEPVDVALLLDGAASLFQPLAEERGITLVLEPLPSIEIQGDLAWLRELFANLLQNAIEHTPAGGHIDISLSERPDEVSITVSDTGEGIDPSEHEHIFERFHRVSPSRDVPGSGLGLALAKQIALAHGGDIYVTSEPGRGSAFSVRLPRPARSHPESTPRRESEARREMSSRGSEPTAPIQAPSVQRTTDHGDRRGREQTRDSRLCSALRGQGGDDGRQGPREQERRAELADGPRTTPRWGVHQNTRGSGEVSRKRTPDSTPGTDAGRDTRLDGDPGRLAEARGSRHVLRRGWPL